MNPTHIVRLHHPSTRTASLIQCFSLSHAEITLAVYQQHGWTGSIEERS